VLGLGFGLELGLGLGLGHSEDSREQGEGFAATPAERPRGLLTPDKSTTAEKLRVIPPLRHVYNCHINGSGERCPRNLMVSAVTIKNSVTEFPL
jgi:hypothetical protein